MKKIGLASFSLLGLLSLTGAYAQPATDSLTGALRELPASSVANDGQRVSLKAFVAMIAEADEMVRVQRLEEVIAGDGVRGAQAIFEPFLTMGLERESMHVLNSAQDAARRGVDALSVFDSRESRFKTAVGMKVATGADIELSYNIASLQDSLQARRDPAISPEKKGYLGVKLTQPLMRGAGPAATRVGIATAQSEEGVARETVRQLLAQRVMEGLQAYVFVQRAQERVWLRSQAREVAIDIERGMAEQNRAGLKSAPELTEARSSLALRLAQLAQAQQELEEQQSALQIYISARDRIKGAAWVGSMFRPGDPLVLANAETSVGALVDPADPLSSIMARRPEARVNAIRIEREGHKLAAALDQRKPELNFTLSYGKVDLANFTRNVTRYLGSDVPYNQWMVGLTYKVGLFGDEKKNSEYQAALSRQEQSELALGAVRQRIANEVLFSSSVLGKALQQVSRQEEIVQAQRSLLTAETELVRDGRRSSMDVLKRKLELLLAQEALADAVTQANRASYLTSQVEGTLLSRLGLE